MRRIHNYSFVLFTSNCFTTTPRTFRVFFCSRVQFRCYFFQMSRLVITSDSTMRMHGIALPPHFGRRKWKKSHPIEWANEKRKKKIVIGRGGKVQQMITVQTVSWSLKNVKRNTIKQNNDLTPLKWLPWTHKKCNFVRIIEKEWCFWYLWRSGHCNHTSEQTHQTPSCASVLLSVFSLWFGRVCTFALVVISSSSLNWTDIIVFVSFRNIIWCKRNWCRCFRLAEKRSQMEQMEFWLAVPANTSSCSKSNDFGKRHSDDWI